MKYMSYCAISGRWTLESSVVYRSMKNGRTALYRCATCIYQWLLSLSMFSSIYHDRVSQDATLVDRGILRPQYSLRGIATYCFFLTSEYLLSFKPLYSCACFSSSDKERNVTSPSIHYLLDVSIDRLASDHQTPHNDDQNIPEPTDRYLRITMQTELT
jgi:hypothetical protein